MDRWQDVKSALRDTIETVLLTLIIFFLVRAFVQNFRIEGTSMEPNLHHGQYLVINKLAYRLHPPVRGDIIVFRYPHNPKRDFIKRVIGLPGERVEVKGGRVFINGQELDEPYPLKAGTYSWGPRILGPDEYFVLGDNRSNSSDSHSWGALPRANIIGKAWVCYWPPRYWGLIRHRSADEGGSHETAYGYR
ncbi:MAG TPA: signal peptidase I [Anaerolineae bacterium]|nr:signal peptidase I [Anaerolineae bacterium]